MKNYLRALICSTFLSSSLFADTDSLPNSINTFASNFYQESFSASNSNEVFSPYCIFNCLSMVYMGSNGFTEEEISRVLCLSDKNLAAPLKELSQNLLPQDGRFQMNIANSLWLDQNASLLPSYRYSVENELGAMVAPIDFSDQKQSAATINQWIKEQTRGLLDQVLSARDIVRRTQLMLVSALYFKGSFEKQFPLKNTRLRSFYKDSSQTSEVMMMGQTGAFPYYEDEIMQLLVIPFAGTSASGGQLACFFALPKNSLQEVESYLGNLSECMKFTSPTKIHASIPRFEIHPRYDLIPLLSNLGMTKSFSREADFSKISGSFDLLINKALHEAVFSLNETGVTAAAVTAIGIAHACVRIEEKPATEFTANHPFIFGIVDLKSNVMLFLGRIIDP